MTRLLVSLMSDAPSDLRIFSPNQVLVAAMLGTTVAAGWLLSRNYARAGQGRTARNVLIGTIVGTVLILLVSIALDDVVRLDGVAIGLAVGFRQAAIAVNKAVEATHPDQPIVKAPWRQVIGPIAGGLSAVILFVSLAIMVAPSTLMHRVTFGESDAIEYIEGASEDDAQRLGGALKEMGFFGLPGGRDVRIAKTPRGYAVDFVFKSEGFGADEESAFRGAALTMSGSLAGSPVDVRLCDEYWRTWKVIVWSESLGTDR